MEIGGKAEDAKKHDKRCAQKKEECLGQMEKPRRKEQGEATKIRNIKYNEKSITPAYSQPPRNPYRPTERDPRTKSPC